MIPYKFHSNLHCHVIDYEIGLFIFLSILPTLDRMVCPKQITQAEEEKEEEEIEIEFQEEEEKLHSREILDFAKIKASNITKVERHDIEEEDLDPLQCTTTFHTYRVNKKDYVLLNDIQHLFVLREDYCLAILD